ncbi:putative protein egg apparatus-1 [Arabidopsis thaliana]|jgi:hypothetical protein|uniref:Uncharacterized protein n=4 Tax=Arabidopsis TaxID=3701 RepID=Q1G3K5_ARATH|nr:uncharacterized protein AT4G33145 [Arabidopsis thaliana]KAG7618238.1 hypothetical protein ISN45_At04g035220 [Arabidopsis thaliana x Arabidopsis arenosa]ABF59374.1 unknown protein [Arabidopsis thaliana]AEE86181.1 hypothetical protein AT4G33145 [Arabidopsis thaliana]OAO97265.1 hypothetical protein AXX17_AT4G37970 [Arabidopsis thaliana]CAA0397326.1 unnamed protein product [Arabidopsis thaliana]|eukprot:NP_001119108.1 hypothetical protein AT4G33145 [Arabidopsis thaliana]
MDKNVSAKASSVAQSSGSSSGTAPGAGNMVAPGSGGSAQIPRAAFEANSKAYFDNLHAKEKANK